MVKLENPSLTKPPSEVLVVVEKLKVVISLVEGVRLRGRDRGLERFDGDME